MFGLAHGTVPFAPSGRCTRPSPGVIATCHTPDAGWFVRRWRCCGSAGFGDGLVLCHMRRHADGAKIGDMVRRIVRLVLTGRDAAACGFASAFSMVSEARRSAVPLRV